MSAPSNLSWHSLPDAESVAVAARDHILQQAGHAIREREAFHIVLAGGSTPERCYQLLAGSESDWQRWHIWFGDERCLPPDHPDRNSRMAWEKWLSHVPIPPQQIHPIPAELDAEAAADLYEPLIRAILPFDLVLLGMGDDGHTASLFPGHRHPLSRLVVPVHDAPKPPPDRVSLNFPALSDCRSMLFLITGKEKIDAVRKWRTGHHLPVSRIQPKHGGQVLTDLPL